MRRYAATAAIAILISALTVVTTALTGCSGCGRGNGAQGTDSLTPEQSRELILSKPVKPDRQSLAGFAEAVRAKRPISLEQTAEMTVLCEAAINDFEAQLDQLQRNDDAADTYNVMAETRHAQWVDDYGTVLAYLRDAQLPDDERQRVDGMLRTNLRVAQQVIELQRAQLRGRSVFSFKPLE